MGATALVAAFLALAAPGASAPPGSLVVFSQEPVCHMGRTATDGTKVRIEYHALDDSYHLLLSGPAVKGLDEGALPWVVVKSGFDRQFYKGRIIPGNPDMPGAIYVPLTYPQHFYGSTSLKLPRNRPIEQRLFDPRGVDVLVGEKLVTTLAGDVVARAASELVKCSNKFAPGGTSSAARRLMQSRMTAAQ